MLQVEADEWSARQELRLVEDSDFEYIVRYFAESWMVYAEARARMSFCHEGRRRIEGVGRLGDGGVGGGMQ